MRPTAGVNRGRLDTKSIGLVEECGGATCHLLGRHTLDAPAEHPLLPERIAQPPGPIVTPQAGDSLTSRSRMPSARRSLHLSGLDLPGSCTRTTVRCAPRYAQSRCLRPGWNPFCCIEIRALPDGAELLRTVSAVSKNGRLRCCKPELADATWTDYVAWLRCVEGARLASARL